MAITLAAFQTACDECRAAISTASWSTAWQKYAEAEAIAAGLELAASDGGTSYQHRQTLEGLAKAIDRAEGAVSRYADRGKRLIRTRVEYARW